MKSSLALLIAMLSIVGCDSTERKELDALNEDRPLDIEEQLGIKEPMEIKGVYVDKKVDCDQLGELAYEGAISRGEEEKYLDIWREKTIYECSKLSMEIVRIQISFLGGISTMVMRQTSDGMIVNVAVFEFDFDVALAAFTKKYGEPTFTLEAGKGYGPKSEKVDAYWKQGDLKLLITNRDDNNGVPVVIISGKIASEERDKDSENI